MWRLLAVVLLVGSVQAKERAFEQVLEAPGSSKEQIFVATKEWLAETFRAARAVDYESREDGTIIANVVTKYPCSGFTCLAKGDWQVPFTLRVDMKDARVRLMFTNVLLQWPGYHGPMAVDGDWENTQAMFRALGESLVKSIAAHKAKANW